MTTAIETKVLRGAALSTRLRAEIAAAKELYETEAGQEATLATLLVGDNAAAKAYRASIDRTFKRVNIAHRHVERDDAITNDDLIATVRELNEDPTITGVLVLMPLPRQLDPHVILEHLSPMKDVDGITPVNAGRMHLGLPSLRPSTPYGGLRLMQHHGIPLDGADVTIIGRSNVVGRPLATLLSHENATVTLCHSHTQDLVEKTMTASVVCLAAGRPGVLTGDMINPGTWVIDFGVNVDAEGKVVGDADIDSIQGIAAGYTPTPGGTGPVTALMLARNVLAAGFATNHGTLDSLPELRAFLRDERNLHLDDQ